MKLALTYVALAALLLGSCAKDGSVENPMKEEHISLQLSATSSSVVVRSGEVLPLPLDVSVGISVAAKDANFIDCFAKNQNYASTAVGALSPFGEVLPISLTVAQSYDVYAYAPYKAGVLDPLAVGVVAGDDVLWSPKVAIDAVSKDNCTAVLAFQHCGAQISFDVKIADDFPADEQVFTSASKIEVSGFYRTGTLNVLTGKVTPTGIADKTITISSVNGSKVLTIPATNFLQLASTMPLEIKVTHGGKEYLGKFSTVFNSGTANLYTITIQRKLTNLIPIATIAPWELVTTELSANEI